MHRRHGRPILARGSATLALALLLTAALALGAPAAMARVRYAAAFGTGPQPCLQSNPCSLEAAVDDAGALGLANGDEVVIEPGTYHPIEEIEVNRAVTIGGAAGGPPPLIEGAEPTALFANDDYVHDLRIDQPSGLIGFAAFGGTAERIYATSAAGVGAACDVLGGTLRDSLCVADPSTGAGISIGAGGPGTDSEALVNDTAVGGYGVQVTTDQGFKVTATATNVIGVGTFGDIEVMTDSKPGSAASLTLGHSDFATSFATGTGASVTPPGANGNLTARTDFVNPVAGDFHEAPGSVTIGAGDLAAVLPGELALDGNPRSGPLTCGAAATVDIGAYQVASPTCATPTPSPAPNPAPSPPPPTAPGLTLLRLSHSSFAVGSGKSRGKGSPPLGTTVSFDLSAPATVTLAILRPRTGKKCHRTPRAARCLVPVGKLTSAGTAGSDQVPFAGRVGGKALTPGRYLLQATAAASGLSSATATVGFRILPPVR